MFDESFGDFQCAVADWKLKILLREQEIRGVPIFNISASNNADTN